MRWYALNMMRSSVPYESRSITTRYGNTHLLVAGPEDAPPVIFLHGMEGSALSWKPQVSQLANVFRTYAVDIIGSCGKSAAVRLLYDNDEYAEWLTDVVDGLGLSRAAFVGISNGAWMVMKFAAQASDRIEKAVMMSVNGLVPVRFPFRLARHIERDSVRAVLELLTGRMLTRGMVRKTMSLVLLPKGVTPDPEELEWFYLLAKYYRYRFPPGPVSNEELRRFKAPVLIMMGEHEHYFDVPAALARACSHLPDLRGSEVIPGVGHNMATDNPRLINARIQEFLEFTR